ncbi:MAG: ATP-binding protein, partial [Acidimicrobiia bacterium]
LYRIVQEGMTNAARHSGGSTISVVVAQRDGWTQAIIEDDGNGFDFEAVRKSGQSVGIHGMTERAELLGGKVRFESSGQGSTIFIEVPT